MPNVTVAATADGLNQFATMKAGELKQAFRTGLEWERDLTVRACDNTWSAPNATPTELIQPYQWQFTPKGTVALDAVESKLRPIKVDIVITAEDLEAFWDTYMVEWFEVGKDPMEWSFPRYIYETVYMPKIIEEMNQNAWSGVYAAPTAGTAGLSVNSVDGYKTNLEAAITAGDLTEYATGAWVSGTEVDQVEAWVDALPVNVRDLPGVIRMSPTLARRYWRNYRAEFGTGNGVANNANNELRVDATNKTILPVISMEGSDRIIFFPETTRNLIWGTRRGFPTYFNIRWKETTHRVMQGTAEIYRFYNVEFWDHLFVNDQA